MNNYAETIVALATPVGTSAIALLRVSGPMTEGLAKIFLGQNAVVRHVKRIDYHDITGTLLDDVLLTFYKGPKSYSGEDTLEITCHGNPFIAQKILEDLLARGCKLAEPGEFTKKAFLNGRIDLSQAEAVMDVIHARSERALEIANQQIRGSLGRYMHMVMEDLLMIIAQVEVYIDFPDEDLPVENYKIVNNNLGDLIIKVSKLLVTNHYKHIINDGIKTVILGQPNAGKSSLLNQLVGYNRALVSPEPGTTRDFIEERIKIGSYLLRLIDTAGFNNTPTLVEACGIEKTINCAAEAELILVIIDGSCPFVPLPSIIQNKLLPQNTIFIINKSDLPLKAQIPNDLANFYQIYVSALTKKGLAELFKLIINQITLFHVEQGDEIIAVNARHAKSLSVCIECLKNAEKKLNLKSPVELLSSELREALNAMGEIIGKIDNERVLDHLFASFCIGK